MIVTLFCLAALTCFLRARQSNELAYDPEHFFTDPKGYVFYRGQHIRCQNTYKPVFKGILRYSFDLECFLAEDDAIIPGEDIKYALTSMKRIFQEMPAGWDPAKPHLFEGRELCDYNGQPVRLIASEYPNRCNFSIVNSSGEILQVTKIKDLCEKKFGKFEVVDGIAHYRGHPVQGLKDLQIITKLNDTVDFSYRFERPKDLDFGIYHFKEDASEWYFPLSSIFCFADIYQLREIVNKVDIEGFKILLEEYPSVWAPTAYGQNNASKMYSERFINRFLMLSPDQKLVDLFFEKYPDSILKYDSDIPATIINCPSIDIKLLVYLYLSNLISLEDLFKRSSLFKNLSYLVLNEHKMKVIAQYLSLTFNPENPPTVADNIQKMLTKTLNEVHIDLKGPFENLLKNIWLELLPNDLQRQPDSFLFAWEMSDGYDLQQSKRYFEKFCEFFELLKKLFPHLTEPVLLRIASNIHPDEELLKEEGNIDIVQEISEIQQNPMGMSALDFIKQLEPEPHHDESIEYLQNLLAGTWGFFPGSLDTVIDVAKTYLDLP